ELIFFFLQAKAGIRVGQVTGVQTCALPICDRLRRPKAIAPPTLKVNGLLLDTGSREVTRDGKRIELTPKEYAVLEYLMRHQGRRSEERRVGKEGRCRGGADESRKRERAGR